MPTGLRPGPASGERGERIAKWLARAGVASRRDVEKLIAERRVKLENKVVETPATFIQPGDLVTVDGRIVANAQRTRLFRYHKPVGLVTTHKDPQGRPTVFAALPAGLPRLISVGRLDLNSEGLLLLTNDGGLARALELPATGLIRLIARCASLLLQPLRSLARLFRLGSSCFQGGLFLPKARLPCTSKDDARSCSRQARSCDRQCRANARCDNR